MTLISGESSGERDPLRDGASEVVKVLRSAGYEGYLAGGCVRDLRLGTRPKDYDVVTNARPEEVAKLFRRTHLVGAAFGVVRVLISRDLVYEVATYRGDGAYEDGRRPETVVYGVGKEEDVRRRDFTINAMLLDPLSGEVIDLVGGLDDLKAQVIRAVGDPKLRFEEDHLRLLRAVRFATRLGFDIETDTGEAMRASASKLSRISRERISAELDGIWSSPAPGRGLELLGDFDLVAGALPFLPEALLGLSRSLGFDQPRVSVSLTAQGARLMKALSDASSKATWAIVERFFEKVASLARLQRSTTDAAALTKPDLVRVAWAVLLEGLERSRVQEALQDLRRSREDLRIIGALIEAAPRLRAPERFSLADARRLVADTAAWPLTKALLHALVGEPPADGDGYDDDDRPAWLRAQAGSSESAPSDARHRFAEVERDLTEHPLPPRPIVTGADLKALGLDAGPAFKALLGKVDCAVLERKVTSRAEALDFVRALVASDNFGPIPDKSHRES